MSLLLHNNNNNLVCKAPTRYFSEKQKEINRQVDLLRAQMEDQQYVQGEQHETDRIETNSVPLNTKDQEAGIYCNVSVLILTIL